MSWEPRGANNTQDTWLLSKGGKGQRRRREVGSWEAFPRLHPLAAARCSTGNTSHDWWSLCNSPGPALRCRSDSSVQTNPHWALRQRPSRALDLFKSVFCNYFSLLYFFSRFYADGWRIKLHLKKYGFFWVVPLLKQILNHVIQSPFWLIGSL